MDTYLLRAAVLFALSATSRTSGAVDDFLQIASFASPDLDPLAYELFDLRAPLERLADSELVPIPRQLQHPVLAIVRASGDALARIDILLEDCTVEESCEVRWNAVRPKVAELRAGLCTCRRTLQLALEVVNLAAAKDDRNDIETLATYLDHDTSRVLALIRRTLQSVQEEDQTDDLYYSLRSALDEIRLLVQDMCKHRDETKLAALQMAASGGSSSHAQNHSRDTSTLVSEPGETSVEYDATEEYAPAPLVTSGSLRPAKKLTNALAKWSLAGASRRSKISSLSSTTNSLSRTSSSAAAAAAAAAPTENSTLEDGASFTDVDTTAQTSRQVSHRSESSHASTSSSSRGDGGRLPRNLTAPSTAPSNASREVLPPLLPPKNPRRNTLTFTQDDLDSGIQSSLLPSPPTPLDSPNFPSGRSDFVSVNGSMRSRASEQRSPASPHIGSPLPLFAISPPDKIVIDPADIPANWNTQGNYRQASSPKVSTSHRGPKALRLMQNQSIPSSSKSDNNKGGDGTHASTVFFLDSSPASYLLASKHGDKTIKIHGLPQCNLQATLKINFYIQMQGDRARDFFVTSHAILSETRSLLAAATRFGDTLEIWNWALNKRIQTIEAVYRWAVAKQSDIYETRFAPLACYREAEDAIHLFSVADETPIMRRQDVVRGLPSPTANSKKKPFGSNPAAVISLWEAGLPCVPKLPELAYSSTAPLLVAAAGPRSARPGHSPPEHAAMLMAWDLATHSGNGSPSSASFVCRQQQRPSYFCMPAHHKELETALPCGLAVHGDFVVSIWIPHNVRVIGSPGSWQCEPVKVPHRFVLVWNMREGSTSVFPIPNENTVACISPDCRYVAYRQRMTGKGVWASGSSLVIVDALAGGRELWRMPSALGSIKYDDQLLSLDPSRISSLSFSVDGELFMVGDMRGSIGVYDVIPTDVYGK